MRKEGPALREELVERQVEDLFGARRPVARFTGLKL